ncbi:MAG: hypothetical protein ABS87_02300 [Sphingomonas sp. SCN 67-18]|uniref:polysaccharide deacetylase family protein n=1 Tax=uncultured Sphingomonas sp. TaxID=158754 RepID=UPI000869DCC3|nr:polysaccharide deacetylase family protein [Sphingomonas sp. SCN 67-18]ODU22392.1 MAG: hypothetical protein ABS87_02300 [Sphingomonas sp. SCN 67-18]
MALNGRLKTMIAGCWDATIGSARRGPKLTILYYHAVAGRHAAAFEQQMRYLKDHCNVVAADHEGPLATNRANVAITFDDAFQSVGDHAVPVLARHGLPATIFVPTGWLGRPPGWQMETDDDRVETVMSAAQIAALPRDLIAIGSHTVDHPRLSQLTPDEQFGQLATSRAALQTMMGHDVDTLAFPYGDYDAGVVDQARAAGYRFIYTVFPQSIAAGDSTPLRGRTAADPADPMHLFMLKARGAFEWMPLASRLKHMVRPVRP